MLYWYIPRTDNVTVAQLEKYSERVTFRVGSIVLAEVAYVGILVS